MLKEAEEFFKRLRDRLQIDKETSRGSLERLGAASFELAQLTSEIGGGADAVRSYEESAAVRERVCAARERQEARLGPGRCNAEMTAAEVRECDLDPAAAALLADLYARRRLSGRAHDRALRLAQTVADLAGTAGIGEAEMAQALQLRRRDHV